MRKILMRLWGGSHVTDIEGSVSGETVGDDDVTAQPADTPRRKSVVPLWRRRSTLAVIVLLGIGALAGTGTWAVDSGWALTTFNHAKWAMIKTSAEQGFTVEDVLVTGRGETKNTDLLDALGVARGAPILAYDFNSAKTRVEGLPWVLSARIERLLPNTLVVHLIERRPIALWQNQGQFALIDEEGVVITRDNLGRFSNLIQIVGEDAPSQVGGLLELLSTQPKLKDRVKAAVRVGGRRWDLVLNSGIDIRLPENGAPQALARLSDFEQETGVLGRKVSILDLRMPDRVIVRRVDMGKSHDTATPASQTKSKSGQET
jgi:cell division protein FtsQ